MKIVIVGLGTIGKTILKNLSNEDHSVTIIDDDKEVIEVLIEKYDVTGVVGNGACLDIQEEAGREGKLACCEQAWRSFQKGLEVQSGCHHPLGLSLLFSGYMGT